MICKSCSAPVSEGYAVRSTPSQTNPDRPRRARSLLVQWPFHSGTHCPVGTVNLCMFIRHQLCGELNSPFSFVQRCCWCTKTMCLRSKSITTGYQSEQHTHKICLICNRCVTSIHTWHVYVDQSERTSPPLTLSCYYGNEQEGVATEGSHKCIKLNYCNNPGSGSSVFRLYTIHLYYTINSSFIKCVVNRMFNDPPAGFLENL